MKKQLKPSVKKMQSHDEIFMREAIVEAKKAFTLGEVPIGCVLVMNNVIIARGHNFVEKKQDASCHAELVCMQKGAKILGNWRLLNTTLYSTLEPCAMCAGAMILFRIKRLVYGADDLRHGADGSVFNVCNASHPIHQVEICKGILKKETGQLMKEFFQMRRKNVEGII